MKKLLLTGLLLLSACATPEDGPPEEVGDFPPDYVFSEDLPSAAPTISGLPTPSGSPSGSPVAGSIEECREQNASQSLEIDSLQKKVLGCQEQLSQTTGGVVADQGIRVGEQHLALIRQAILNTPQKEFAFGTCGQMGNFIRESWYEKFTTSLAQAKIRFSNGFLDTEDLFGGCQSTEGNMTFFLGAERGEDLGFFLLKFRTDTQTLEPAVRLDGAENAVVIEFGKREGPYILFPADDGRKFRYYYDANVVVAQ